MVKPFELKGANLELWKRWNSKMFFNHGEDFELFFNFEVS